MVWGVLMDARGEFARRIQDLKKIPDVHASVLPNNDKTLLHASAFRRFTVGFRNEPTRAAQWAGFKPKGNVTKVGGKARIAWVPGLLGPMRTLSTTGPSEQAKPTTESMLRAWLNSPLWFRAADAHAVDIWYRCIHLSNCSRCAMSNELRRKARRRKAMIKRYACKRGCPTISTLEVFGASPVVAGVRDGCVVVETGVCGVCTWGDHEAVDPAHW
jgi:hypothetical protein